MKNKEWKPLDPGKLDEINGLFHTTYPENEYGTLASEIGSFWIDLLKKSWNEKPEELKTLDLAYDPADPLSRVRQKTTVITYADSISRQGEPTLKTLDEFLKKWFPNIGGLHILPACTVVEDRFNDGYFSQVERNAVHSAFGTDDFFADVVHRYFSMNDLVMGHVDIENPAFKAYLEGDDDAGKTFYTFSEEEYQRLKAAGSFAKVFRPRPFPLFTIFRRTPESIPYSTMPYDVRAGILKNIIAAETKVELEPEVMGILFLFAKVRNDQMLLDEDFAFISDFIGWMKGKGMRAESVFTRSITQEVQHIPWIFINDIESREELLRHIGFSEPAARLVAEVFEREHYRIFGEEIRALTTFSHVQVDVNTTTFQGLKRFGLDLAWYLTKDLNMLRLDAVNYAFKKWGTSCFGLPELDRLMKIVYLSMECISPRMIPNLEVNDSLTTILNTMTSGSAAPPMMHDFQLASLLPAVFHLQDPAIIKRVFDKIAEYNVPKDSIRFSLSESHDGKSVRGSMDLLKFEERRVLTEAVLTNGGYVKYKSIPPRESTQSDWEKFCSETELDPGSSAAAVFEPDGGGDNFILKAGITSVGDVKTALPALYNGAFAPTADFFFTRILEGRDPYELCITTRDALPRLIGSGDGESAALEADRFLAFETLAFAVMGRNVKTIYFNDLLGLPNDFDRVKKSGELRDIKRTKSDYDALLPELENSTSFTSRVAYGINELIGLVDSDPALHFRGEEAALIQPEGDSPVAVVLNRCGKACSIILVNLSEKPAEVSFSLPPGVEAGPDGMRELFSNDRIAPAAGRLTVELNPFGRMWLKV